MHAQRRPLQAITQLQSVLCILCIALPASAGLELFGEGLDDSIAGQVTTESNQTPVEMGSVSAAGVTSSAKSLARASGKAVDVNAPHQQIDALEVYGEVPRYLRPENFTEIRRPSQYIERKDVRNAIRIARGKARGERLDHRQLFPHVPTGGHDETVARIATAAIVEMRYDLGEKVFQRPPLLSPATKAFDALELLFADPAKIADIRELLHSGSASFASPLRLSLSRWLSGGSAPGLGIMSEYRFEKIYDAINRRSGLGVLDRDRYFGHPMHALTRTADPAFDARPALATSTEELHAMPKAHQSEAVENGLFFGMVQGRDFGLPKEFVEAMESLPAMNLQYHERATMFRNQGAQWWQVDTEEKLALEALIRATARGDQQSVRQLGDALRATVQQGSDFGARQTEDILKVFENFAARFAVGNAHL